MKDFTYASESFSKDITLELDFNRFLVIVGDFTDVPTALVIFL
jgi:hypothetical protein